MTTPIAALVDRAHGHRAPGAARMRRVVLRMPAGDVARVDALCPRFSDASRATLIRAFIAFGLLAAEEHVKATMPASTTLEADHAGSGAVD